MKYTINKGQTDWTPRDPFQLFGKFKEVTIECTPTTSMEFDYVTEGGLVDLDWRDWKKIGGISFVSVADFRTWRNIFDHSRDAIHLGWRWNPELLVHEFNVYVNNKGGRKAHWEPHELLRVSSGTKVSMIIHRDSKWRYAVHIRTSEAGRIFQISSRFGADFYSRSGMWYGGMNNAPGEYGGAAPKYMECETNYFIKR